MPTMSDFHENYLRLRNAWLHECRLAAACCPSCNRPTEDGDADLCLKCTLELMGLEGGKDNVESIPTKE